MHLTLAVLHSPPQPKPWPVQLLGDFGHYFDIAQGLKFNYSHVSGGLLLLLQCLCSSTVCLHASAWTFLNA